MHALGPNIWPVPLSSNGAPFQWEELEKMTNAFIQRLREGSLPPDDTFWWTRILYAEAKSLGLIPDALR